MILGNKVSKYGVHNEMLWQSKCGMEKSDPNIIYPAGKPKA
jgi:hypothetical protein